MKNFVIFQLKYSIFALSKKISINIYIDGKFNKDYSRVRH
ncbi:hypothetical protein TRIP_D440307 [uncultured Paludibacter sp.]|uniref:Uncharacterized protein n=1 Tax=uncultured Paludibacter sp. TaxID=497635 RepID=A0A653AJQ5_9BACT|nr:hypothetical protein TRIP_D440307 [uncultured Paludibacter sp.]